jgi:hypothetical protein
VGQDEQQLRDFFEGRTDDYGVLEDNGMNMDIDEILGRGVFDLADGQAMYVTQRGSVAVEGGRGEGLTGMALIDCPQDERRRIALWFGPDTTEEVPDDDAATARSTPSAPAAVPEALSGSPADPDALRTFLANFRFCDR